MDVSFRGALDSTSQGDVIDRLEKRIRTAMPAVKHIYIEANSLTDTSRRSETSSPADR